MPTNEIPEGWHDPISDLDKASAEWSFRCFDLDLDLEPPEYKDWLIRVWRVNVNRGIDFGVATGIACGAFLKQIKPGKATIDGSADH